MSDKLLSLYCFTKTLGARFRHDRRGLESLEWAVIAAVVVIAAIGAYTGLLKGVNSFFGSVSNAFSNASSNVTF